MTADVTAGEVARLARAMTLKNAAAGLPHGGGKAGIHTPAGFGTADSERVLRAFGYALRDLRDYIPGPDMGTNETAMAWIHDETGRAVGLPRALGGIPLDEIGATGYGLAVCAEALGGLGRLQLDGARIAIQGFGAVGSNAARFLVGLGAKIVAVSDRSGGVYEHDGLDITALADARRQGRPIADTPDLKPLTQEDLLTLDCDVLIPAAQPDVITEFNADLVRARIVLPGANIAVTRPAEAILRRRGVLVVPDFIANAGGVICAATEYRGGDEAQAFAAIARQIHANTTEVIDRMAVGDRSATEAGMEMALERISAAAVYRRKF
jgi:glutamate dehydrogenase (NAD(P)+)